MASGKNRPNLYLALLIVLASAFVVYWTAFANYRYQSFQSSFWDLGQEAYSMYIHLHYAGMIGGLQYLSFSNHISPFKILELPLFALWQSPLSLVFLQNLALALAAIVAYFIGRDVAKSRYFGFCLAVAFLVSAGVRGIAFFDLHVEAYIPLFLLLSFYFYMTGRRNCFLGSYVLLLSVLESSVAVGATLLAALLAYELFYPSKKANFNQTNRRGRMRMLAMGIVITLAFAAFYWVAAHCLLSLYQSGSYSQMPPFIKLIDFGAIQVKALLNLPSVVYSAQLLPYVTLFGFLILLMGFGLTVFRNPYITAILISPWIIEVLVVHNVGFGYLSFHYYAYVVGGAAVASVLGYLIMSREGFRLAKIRTGSILNVLSTFLLISSITISIVLLYGVAPNPETFIPTNISTPGIFIPANWNLSAKYLAMESALSEIPANTSVMAQPSVLAHLYYARYPELPPQDRVGGFTANGPMVYNIPTLYTQPQYIVVDSQLPDYSNYNSPMFNIYRYMGDNYTQFGPESSIQIYRLST